MAVSGTAAVGIHCVCTASLLSPTYSVAKENPEKQANCPVFENRQTNGQTAAKRKTVVLDADD